MPIAQHGHDLRTPQGQLALQALQHNSLVVAQLSTEPSEEFDAHVALVEAPPHLYDVWDMPLEEGDDVACDIPSVEFDAFPALANKRFLVTASRSLTLVYPGAVTRQVCLVWPLATAAGCSALSEVALSGQFMIARFDLAKAHGGSRYELVEDMPMRSMSFGRGVAAELLEAVVLGRAAHVVDTWLATLGGDDAPPSAVVSPPAEAFDVLLRRIGGSVFPSRN